jgi:hypothetical protein
MYGNIEQQKQQAKALLQKLRPSDIRNPEKNEEFFDQVKKLNLKMISLGISPERVGEDCMTVLVNHMNREYLRAFFMEAHIGVSTQDTFYLTNSSAWYLRFCDWFNQFIRMQKSAPSERESWETAYSSAQQPAAAGSEQTGKQTPSKNSGCQQSAGSNVKMEAQAQITSAASDTARLEKTLLKIESVLSSKQAPSQSEKKKPAQKQQNSKQTSQSSDKEGTNDKTDGKSKKGNGKKKQQRRKNKCKFCESTEHAMNKCPLTIDQRVQALADKNMCSNCQYRGHVVADCRNNNTCHNCPGDQVNKHMTLLCPRGGQQAQPAAAGQNGAGGAQPAHGQPQGGQ